MANEAEMEFAVKVATGEIEAWMSDDYKHFGHAPRAIPAIEGGPSRSKIDT
jgi:hypothetical protein